MPDFDPQRFREMVRHFASTGRSPFQTLLPAQDVIAELRKKGASFTVITQLLNQHGLYVSRSQIARFCHRVLGEKVVRRRLQAYPGTHSLPAPPISSPPVLTPANPSPEPTPPLRAKGPRIAHVRPANPNQQ